tara:strand:+ start:1873 stop:2928 length:1056 start_codon:yes stop_codon:yes gene_type:complete
MGLLDIWNDWKKESGYGSSIEDIAKQSQYGQMDFSTQTQKKQDKDPRGFTGIGTRVTGQEMQKPNVVPSGYKDAIMSGGAGAQQGDIGFFQKLANMANVDFDKAAAQWKDKGGFEGLMANPAFTLGLAFMQAGANGQTIGQQSLDNILKAGAISTQYKSILESRKQAPIQATAADVAEVKDLLKTMNIENPNIFEKIVGKVKGKNVQAMFDVAAEDIAVELQKEMQRLQKANKSGTPLVFDTRRKLEIIKKLQRQGKFKKKGGIPFVTAATLESDVKVPTREHGGPIKKGKAYVVGEAGPEVIIPKSDGNVLANDDSQIYAMLLAANPQLQKVSRQRAEKILRARFPEYFE